jgi:hypothetical protein
MAGEPQLFQAGGEAIDELVGLAKGQAALVGTQVDMVRRVLGIGLQHAAEVAQLGLREI